MQHPITHAGGVMKRRQLSKSTPKSEWLLSTCVIGAAVMSNFAPTSVFAAQDCAGLANLKIDNTNLLSATGVPASGDLPAYCRGRGDARSPIHFEILLPMYGWSGKFYQVGCGSFCGSLNSEAPGFANAMN